MKFYGVVGAGGHGRESMPLAWRVLAPELNAGEAELCFVVEGVVPEGLVNGYRVVSADQFLSLPGERRFNVAIGNSKARERIASRFEASGCTPFSIFAPNSVVMDCNEIAEGALLSPFAMITSNVKVGRHFQGNMYSYVAHDCTIGDFVTFGPGVKCNGNVVVEDHAYIGAGAMLKQGAYERPLVIGRGAIVGMGAVVTRSVAPNTTVVGNPARLLGSGE